MGEIVAPIARCMQHLASTLQGYMHAHVAVGALGTLRKNPGDKYRSPGQPSDIAMRRVRGTEKGLRVMMLGYQSALTAVPQLWVLERETADGRPIVRSSRSVKWDSTRRDGDGWYRSGVHERPTAPAIAPGANAHTRSFGHQLVEDVEPRPPEGHIMEDGLQYTSRYIPDLPAGGHIEPAGPSWEVRESEPPVTNSRGAAESDDDSSTAGADDTSDGSDVFSPVRTRLRSRPLHWATQNTVDSTLNGGEDEADVLVQTARAQRAGNTRVRRRKPNNPNDLPWTKMKGGSRWQECIEACASEIDSICSTIGTVLQEGTQAYLEALRLGTKCRVILSEKRSGKIKCRLVKCGHLEDAVAADGAGFDYAAQVTRLSTIRLCLTRPNRKDRAIAVIDISTAFLQADKYADGFLKHVLQAPHYWHTDGPATKRANLWRAKCAKKVPSYTCSIHGQLGFCGTSK